jgi:3-methyladenine DNA glycosylase AlkD
MEAKKIADKIKKELSMLAKSEASEKKKNWTLNQHKSAEKGFNVYGLENKILENVVRKYYKMLKGDYSLALDTCEEMLKSNFHEDSEVGLKILRKATKEVDRQLFNRFSKWIDYIKSWATVDTLCLHFIGQIILGDSSRISNLIDWTKSENRWRRRCAAVTMVPFARRGEHLKEILEIAEKMIEEKDDIVLKGIGWMLKDISHRYPEEISEFLEKWKEEANASLLRYASELLPKELKVFKTK